MTHNGRNDNYFRGAHGWLKPAYHYCMRWNSFGAVTCYRYSSTPLIGVLFLGFRGAHGWLKPAYHYCMRWNSFGAV